MQQRSDGGGSGGAAADARRRQRRPGGHQDGEKGSSSSTVDVAKMLTNAIAGAATVEQLRDLADVNAARLDHIHVAALVSRAAHLSGAAAPLLEETDGHMAQAEQQLGAEGDVVQAPERDGSKTSSTSGSSGGSASDTVLPLLCRLLAQRLRHTSPASLSASLWGLGRFSQVGLTRQLAAALAATPAADSTSAAAAGAGSAAAPSPGPDSWGRRDPRLPRRPLLPALGARTVALAADMSGQELATALWGLARAGFAPDAAWVEACSSAAAAAMEAPGRCSAADCALMLYAFALMRRRPGPAFMAAWEAATLRLGLASANPQDVSTMLWAAGTLGVTPSAEWLAAAFEASAPQLGGYGPQALSNCAYGLAALGVAPPDAWLAALLAAMEGGGSDDEEEAADSDSSSSEGSRSRGAAAITPQAFSCTLASLAKLGVGDRIDPGWLSGMLDRSAAALPTFRPLELSNTVWALARLNRRPPDAWMAAFLGACRTALLGFTPHQLVNVLWSLALLRRPPPMDWLGAALSTLQPSLRRLSPRTRQGLIWALTSMGANPGGAWLSEFLGACFDAGLADDQAACANVLFCVSSLDMDFLASWLDAYMSGTPSSPAPLGDAMARYGQLAGVLAAMAAMDGRRLRSAWVDFTDADWSGEPGDSDEAGSAALRSGPPGFDDMYRGRGGKSTG